ncbi:alpha/beta hydrolase [Gordonia sp. (in: high G+C Gram-positive bacteria)]|uniref:alpha/beta hydrolase n=1 Tax=Gordonia sp. (in: high G+C Gram-positive bacteria) TaxID=84139 RepID=UPI0039E31C15
MGAGTAASTDIPVSDWGARRRLTHLSYGGMVGATVLLLASGTPSLLPRTWIFQGVISGGAAAAGYAVGVLLAWLTRFMVSRDRAWPRPQRFWWWALAFVGVFDAVVMTYWNVRWQNEIRDFMGIDRVGFGAVPLVLAVALGVFLGCMLIGKLWLIGMRELVDLLRRFIPSRLATALGAYAAIALTVLLVNGVLVESVMRVLNNTFAAANNEMQANTPAPTSPLRSGGPGSTVSWDSLGREGRVNIASGPTVAQLTAFNGAPAKEPIRVYAGLGSGEELTDIAQAAVRELERTGGFRRKLIAIGNATGLGWLNKSEIDTLEYMYNGDTALVSMQYSYLPSWISFLVDKERARQAGTALFEAVSERVRDLPEAQRPKLVVFGESLGSFAGESPFGSIPTVAARTDGALFTGPTFNNRLWEDTTRNRDPGSPQVQPVFNRGKYVRFVADETELDRPATPWRQGRIVYVQHPSDPVTWFNPTLLLREPDWLKEKRGRDVLPTMRWIPVVTFLQVSADMAVANGVPDGHGHHYLRVVPFAWATILQPPGWTDEKTRRLLPLLVRGE